jgi:hypothetical protein
MKQITFGSAIIEQKSRIQHSRFAFEPDVPASLTQIAALSSGSGMVV